MEHESALGGYLLLNLNTAKMHVRQLRAHFRQARLPRRDFVAVGASELFKPRRFLALIARALIVRYLSDQIHRGKHRNASFEALADLFALLSESELSILPGDMAAFASVCIEYVLGDLQLTLTRGLHFIEGRYVFLL